MSADAVCAVPARMEHLPAAIAFAEAFCAAHGVATGEGLRLSLVIEELFTNSVVHGHGGGADAAVRIALHADSAHLHLSYEDSAPPFDLLAHHARSRAALDADVADRPVGQLGIPLVVSTAEHIAYAHADGCNRIRLALRRKAP
jgi:anti-sigma regulatory factor (Ser/Thr protein kinase)